MGRGTLAKQTGFLCNVLVASLQEGSAYHASNGMSALGGASAEVNNIAAGIISSEGCRDAGRCCREAWTEGWKNRQDVHAMSAQSPRLVSE